MINVAYIAMAPFISGSERCLQLILSNCQATGINPILITPKDSPMRVWAQKNKIRHYSCDLSPLEVNFWSWCLTQLKLVRIFTKHKVQVAHSNQIWSFRVLINVSTPCCASTELTSNGASTRSSQRSTSAPPASISDVPITQINCFIRSEEMQEQQSIPAS